METQFRKTTSGQILLEFFICLSVFLLWTVVMFKITEASDWRKKKSSFKYTKSWKIKKTRK